MTPTRRTRDLKETAKTAKKDVMRSGSVLFIGPFYQIDIQSSQKLISRVQQDQRAKPPEQPPYHYKKVYDT